MRKIILNLAVSLDNLIEGPNGEYDWCFTDQDYGFSEFLARVDTVFYGRKSFELFGNSPLPENPSENEKEMLNGINRLKKYVFSTTLKSAEGAVVISSNLVEEVNRIKQQPGKDIFLFGGASLITAFVNYDLVDEYALAVHPVILGAGKPLFIDIKERKKLKLVDSKVYSSGLAALWYIPEK
ncbi:MAG: dihydrofolate reductase family protein [Ignavibacteriaceae bacterium]